MCADLFTGVMCACACAQMQIVVGLVFTVVVGRVANKQLLIFLRRYQEEHGEGAQAAAEPCDEPVDEEEGGARVAGVGSEEEGARVGGVGSGRADSAASGEG